jgi:ABC-type transport system involved in cytochrome c biogenesis permease subunit
MLDQMEWLLFWLATGTYAVTQLLFYRGWRQDRAAVVRSATQVMWIGFFFHTAMIALRWYRAQHVPFLSAFEFVTFFAFLVAMVFLLFAMREKNRALGLFLMPVVLLLMVYAALLNRVIEPEIPIFDSVLLKVHVLTTLFGYAAWSITFAASVCFLYLERKPGSNPGMFDLLAYRAAFFAFCFLTLGILTGALWGDRVFGRLWFWDPKETWSFITWLIFLAYLHARYTLDWRGRRAAILAIVGFAAVLFTYVGVDFLIPQIHGVQN